MSFYALSGQQKCPLLAPCLMQCLRLQRCSIKTSFFNSIAIVYLWSDWRGEVTPMSEREIFPKEKELSLSSSLSSRATPLRQTRKTTNRNFLSTTGIYFRSQARHVPLWECGRRQKETHRVKKWHTELKRGTQRKIRWQITVLIDLYCFCLSPCLALK